MWRFLFHLIIVLPPTGKGTNLECSQHDMCIKPLNYRKAPTPCLDWSAEANSGRANLTWRPVYNSQLLKHKDSNNMAPSCNYFNPSAWQCYCTTHINKSILNKIQDITKLKESFSTPNSRNNFFFWRQTPPEQHCLLCKLKTSILHKALCHIPLCKHFFIDPFLIA